MGTNDNLMAAFAGESQANRKYLAYAQKADKDGFPGVARLFRAAAAAETVHALAHFKAAGHVNETIANLKDAAAGEHYEFTKMYPPFVEDARKEGHAAGEKSMSHALAVEKIHHALYNAALAAVQSGKDIGAKSFFVCALCGNTVEGESDPGKCPICNAVKWDRVS